MPAQMTPRPLQPVPAAPQAVQPSDILHPPPSALRAITGTDHQGLSDQILNAVSAALCLPEGAGPAARAEAAAAAMAAVHGFAPRDPVEGMMAAQAVALHHAAMACFGRAMLPGQSAEVMERLHRQGASLCRAMAEMAEAIDRRHGLIRGWTASHAAAHDGARLAELVDAGNTAGDVWADTAYRSAKNEAWLAERGLVSRIHRKKLPGRPMAARTRQANARKSVVRAAVEHVFARQKGPMALVVRTIGIARARVKIGLANLVYNIKRLVWLSSKAAPA